MIADCIDCEVRVELHHGRCPRCGGASVLTPGGVPDRFARLPFLKRLRAIVTRDPKRRVAR